MLNVKLVKAFEDNYIFLLTCEETGETAVVDPGDASVVESSLNGHRLDKILLTHHHFDHVGGVKKLCEIYNSEVYGCEFDVNRLPLLSHAQKEGDIVTVGCHEAHVLFLPGHTLGHIAYYFKNQKMLFCGDVLFAGGCGRLFEGSFSDMFNSLVKLKILPDDVLVYCAHEYTVDNYKFAQTVAPEDESVNKALSAAIEKIKQGKSTIPTLIGYERSHNIFMKAESLSEFKKLRKLKDVF